MRTLLLIAFHLVVSLILTACVLAAIVVTVPIVGADWRIGAVVIVALTAGFFVLLWRVWPGERE